MANRFLINEIIIIFVFARMIQRTIIKSPNRLLEALFILLLAMAVLMISGCSDANERQVDNLNEFSYAWHYRNLDSTKLYADSALALAGNYDDGRAEALNNLAFVATAKMDYDKVKKYISELDKVTDNQIELAIADVQLMRLCQRESHNKDFYDYRERAQRRLRRIKEERNVLNNHQRRRLIYANTEFQIVSSTYFYYVGIADQSIAAIDAIDPNGEILRDTAQILNYYYNIGSGGIITDGTKDEVSQTEFDYLMRCYMLAINSGYPYFEAQSMQGLSEHLQSSAPQNKLFAENQAAISYLNADDMPDSLLAGNLALRAHAIFNAYGDVYQIAGSYRTLAECYWVLKDYRSALICLQDALYKDTIIQRAPDLVASIREQLSIVYSAVDDKPNSDINRNVYLDMQEKTRQDRLLEARADQLQKSSSQLNWMIIAVIVMIGLVIILLWIFDTMRRKNDSQYSEDKLLQPLKQWKEVNDKEHTEKESEREEIEEQTQLSQIHIQQSKRLNLEQRAKISLVNSITPLIDRIIHEIKSLRNNEESEELKSERLVYITELTDEINAYNAVLTNWIQLRQGELSLHIESFPIKDLFNIIDKNHVGFQLKGVELEIEDTDAIVKADKTLTLFMINTLADNARKFTPRGGKVIISAEEKESFVEISVKDTGIGMTPEQLNHLFDHKPITDEHGELKEEKSHGFGLMNCKGIIDKYRKISQVLSVCSIGAESEGIGSRLWFRLPKGVARLIVILFMMSGLHANAQTAMQTASAFADSTYFSNLAGTYEKTLAYADSCIQYLNLNYHLRNRHGKKTMVLAGGEVYEPAELQWFQDSLNVDYNVILNMRNEVAVAALALHKWDLYSYNNKVYTQLFRNKSADKTLSNYVYVMQKSESNKNVAIIILVLLLILIIPAYYLLYYRFQLYYRFNIERINKINGVLLSEAAPEEKIQKIDFLWKGKKLMLNGRFAPLDNLVLQIKDALQKEIDVNKKQRTDLELAKDELNRSHYENAKLHVSNSVLDNCLSTLKHETMYYPSRIRQLIETPPLDMRALGEVADYYKAIYSMLSAQAMRQIEGMLRVDKDMTNYLFDILKKQSGEQELSVKEQERDEKYTILTVPMKKLSLTEEQCQQLFTPLTLNIQYLLCRQIVRDIGEVTNARACGISAEKAEVGIIMKIVLPKEIWKNSRS
ncbi:Histidine kinase-, DNA gyrase B-, and HSP90-like ATPase [Prevotella sp. KH2C16]|nr:Histidine kinase-, DNA gyrase B-, and HSP90-like ATPase [Prevotella sp. KH2C16]